MTSFASSEDSQNLARQFQQRSRHWIWWYGNRTGHYWAATRFGRVVLVEGRTPNELLSQIIRVEESGEPRASNPGT
jgi:hypothetical protein